MKKLFVLLNELTENPFEGTRKPEALKHNYSGYWFRRINLEHRLVYKVQDHTILIYSARVHYL